jgi:hypothetical protein
VAKGRVLTQGFLTDVDVPSEERLAIHVDVSNMTDVEHMEWVRGLQDLLRTIDVNYKVAVTGKNEVRPLLKRRSVRVRYVRDEAGRQVKVATFHPYPSMLVNKLKGLRHKVYDLLNQNCLILQEERIGRMKRKLYFLPASLAPEVMAHIEALNGELKVLAGGVAEFEESGHFADIMEHVAKAGSDPNGFRANLTPIRVSPVPLSLSREFFTQYLEEEKRRALSDVDEKRRAGLEVLEREMQRKREEMLEALKRDLQGRFSSVMAMAEEAVKAALKGGKASGQAASKRLSELSRLIKSVGVEFDPKPFEALGSILSAAGRKNAETVKEAVRELAESLGVQPSGDALRDMELASRAVRGKSLLLLTID